MNTCKWRSSLTKRKMIGMGDRYRTQIKREAETIAKKEGALRADLRGEEIMKLLIAMSIMANSRMMIIMMMTLMMMR
jgi:hypothetical protein